MTKKKIDKKRYEIISLEKIICDAIRDKVFPGCVVGLIDKEKEKWVLPFGKFKFGANATQMSGDTIFDVASITKSIPTSSLALKALELGKIELEDKIIDWVPEYRNSYKNDARIKHLLTHTLDYDFRLSECKDLSPKKLLDVIMTSRLRTKPGKKFSYCNATSIILGVLIERVFGEKLPKLASKYFFDPLSMDRTFFNPDKKYIKQIVPTEIDEWRGKIIKGEIHDESAWVINKIINPGSAGLFSCVPDLLTYLEMLLNGGKYKSNKYFSTETINKMSTNQIPETGEVTGLGWELNQSRYMGTASSDRTIGKTGFTGCFVACDLIKGIGVVLLSNHTWPKRKNQKDSINKVRQEICDLFFK